MNERDKTIVEVVRATTWETMVNGIGDEAFDARCCVASTRIAAVVLKRYYLHVRAMKVKVDVLSPAMVVWQDAGEQGDPPPKAGVRRCGYGLSPEHARDRQWLDGHVVGIVDDEILLDTSAPQFSTIEAGLLVPPVALDLTEVPGWLRCPHESHVGAVLPDGGVVYYRQHEDLTGLYDAPDWCARPQEIARFVDAIDAKVRAAL